MYPVSDLYKTAVQENARSFTWSGNITTATGKNYPFVNKDIVKGSGYITRQCSAPSILRNLAYPFSQTLTVTH